MVCLFAAESLILNPEDVLSISSFFFFSWWGNICLEAMDFLNSYFGQMPFPLALQQSVHCESISRVYKFAALTGSI